MNERKKTEREKKEIKSLVNDGRKKVQKKENQKKESKSLRENP